jgi:hypothetical protein
MPVEKAARAAPVSKLAKLLAMGERASIYIRGDLVSELLTKGTSGRNWVEECVKVGATQGQSKGMQISHAVQISYPGSNGQRGQEVTGQEPCRVSRAVCTLPLTRFAAVQGRPGRESATMLGGRLEREGYTGYD